MTPRPAGLRRGVLVAVGTLVLAACAGTGGHPTAGDPVDTEQIPSSETEDVVSALDDLRDGHLDDPALPQPLVGASEIRSGGPPPDGIPAIDEPAFLTVDDVDFLDDDEPVLALEVDGDARAYPVQIMTWHEIVNDTVAHVPVAVSYCPLCNSAVAYDRRVDDRVLDFGTSGSLLRSSLVMYDRQTESLWSHFTGQAVAGVLTGATLEVLPVQTISWADFRDAHPDGLVLSRDTGYSRDYGRNPYPGYDDVDEDPFLFTGEVDGRYPAKERVIGVEVGDEALAIVRAPLAEAGVVRAEVGGRPIVAFHEPGTASALDAATVAAGHDVGAVGVFDPVVDGDELTFHRSADGFVDEQTSSAWNVLGTAIDGPLAGTRLEAIPHVDTFWFAWGAFRPDTEVVG